MARVEVGATLLGILSLLALDGCATGPGSDEEDLAAEVVQQGLGSATASSTDSTSSSASTSTVTLAWALEGPLVERVGAGTYALEVQNNEDSPVDAEIVLELDGLGAHRTRSLGNLQLAARERRVLSWSPASSPIAPWGTLARVTAEARYTRDGLTQKIPAPLLFLSFSRNGTRAFASVEDGELVRLASLGRRASPWNKGALTSADRDAQLTQLGSRRGRLDGTSLDESPGEVLTRRARGLAAKAAARARGTGGPAAVVEDEDEDDVGDTISRDGDVPVSAQGIVIPPIYTGPIASCPGVTFPVTTPTCISLRPTGFRDLDVVAPIDVPEEHANLDNYPAAYANAAIYESGTLRWSGRLDANGCSPEVWYCPQNARIEVSTASFQIPGNTLIPRTRDIRLSPARTFIAQVVLASSPATGLPIGAANVRASTAADQRLLRIASVVARILRMPDNGLRDGFAPPLNLHTENGCCDYPEFHYGTLPSGQPLCGEACADETDAWFGQNLARQSSGQYAPTSIHSTQDAYVIGHELGHSIQRDAHGGPIGADYTDIEAVGDCSCTHVRDGSQKHCLQSSHNVQAAEVEGFAHFYATRIMNNKGADARFTYYKDVRRFGPFYVNGVPLIGAYPVAPPVPINAGRPAYDPSWYGQTNGWCGSSATLRTAQASTTG
ncbi:MAG: hypothetical protein BGO98_23035 [Myxococcales bacterium 68-20]|nr:MAG: hypothetical protein BGO98_23035 [Myxococcales bacterium 68-20]